MGQTTDAQVVGGGAGGSFALARPEGAWVMRQAWRDLLFLHWEVSARAVRETLPAGLGLDTFEGKAYVGVVPFQMARVRPRCLPPVPGISWFGELNLRTYVVGPDGRPGVWFYSLDAHQRLAVWLARTFFALPYHHAKIRQRDQPDSDRWRRIAYYWQRQGAGGARLQDTDPAFVYRAPITQEAEPTVPGSLAHWLVERYLLYSRRPLFVSAPGRTQPAPAGRLRVGRVEHPPYRVHEVPVERFDVSLFGLNGLEVPEGPPVSALWSPGVDVSVYPLHNAGGGGRDG